MNWTNLAAAAQILSSVAVFVTLIYLAIQTRQNTKATQANGRHIAVSTDVALLLHEAEHASAFAGMADPQLSDEQKVRFASWMTAVVRLRELDWINFREGVLDKATWQSHRSALAILLSMPNFRKYWTNVRPHLDPGFVSTVDKIVQQTPTVTTNPSVDLFS